MSAARASPALLPDRADFRVLGESTYPEVTPGDGMDKLTIREFAIFYFESGFHIVFLLHFRVFQR